MTPHYLLDVKIPFYDWICGSNEVFLSRGFYAFGACTACLTPPPLIRSLTCIRTILRPGLS